MERIYLDNAATTELRDEVRELLHNLLDHSFGNPSAIYSYGREVKNDIEKARKNVSQILGVRPGEICFTSGGTEATNTALWGIARNGDIERIITSPIEHHATLSTAESISRQQGIELIMLDLDEKGRVNLETLADILNDGKNTLVSLMHANNEVGNLTDAKKLGEICDQDHITLHMDMVQTIGHFPIDLKDLKIDLASGSSHKYHGPKGVGLLYVNQDKNLMPLLTGGSQERNMRAGTENVMGILGLEKALVLSTENMEEEKKYIQGLKEYTIQQIEQNFPEFIFHGDPTGDSLYTIVNIGIPNSDKSEMLLMHMDMQGVCLSGGSACSSGIQSSHVISNIYGTDHPYTPLRISLSKNNKISDIDSFIAKLKSYISEKESKLEPSN